MTIVSEVLVSGSALVRIRGKMKVKLYRTWTSTVLPGFLSGIHVDVTVICEGSIPGGV